MMSQHPANRLLRTVILVVGLISIGQWAWVQIDSPPQPKILPYVYGFGLPLLLLLAWFVFTSPDEPVPSRKPIVPVPGGVRLTLEFMTFSFSVWSLLAVGRLALALALAIAIFLHYHWSPERVLKLLKR
jgi:hypothetical protein